MRQTALPARCVYDVGDQSCSFVELARQINLVKHRKNISIPSRQHCRSPASSHQCQCGGADKLWTCDFAFRQLSSTFNRIMSAGAKGLAEWGLAMGDVCSGHTNALSLLILISISEERLAFKGKPSASKVKARRKLFALSGVTRRRRSPPQLLAFGVYIPSDVHLIISSHHSDIVCRPVHYTLESAQCCSSFGAVLVAARDMNFLHKLQSHLSDANNYDAEWRPKGE